MSSPVNPIDPITSIFDECKEVIFAQQALIAKYELIVEDQQKLLIRLMADNETMLATIVKAVKVVEERS